MASPLTEIVSEVSRANPGAPPDEICRGIMREIEATLPEILRTISLPSPPSSLRLKLEELRLRRAGKRRTALRERFRYRRTFIQQLEYIKSQLNGRPANTSFFFPSITFADFDAVSRPAFRPTNRSALMIESPWMGEDGTPGQRLGFTPVEAERRRFEYYLPYTVLREEREGRLFPSLILDPEVRERLLADRLFGTALKAIEVRIRSLSEDLSRMNFAVSLRTDIEVPEWKKTILTVSASGMDFGQKMSLWDKIDAEVREALENVAKYASMPDKDKLKVINKNLFVKMELP